MVMVSVGDQEAVAQRGRDAGVASVRRCRPRSPAIAEQVTARVRAAGPDDLVGTPIGGMRLADYLPTPELAAAASLHLVGELAARAGKAARLLLVATGRTDLPMGFTVP